jgi:hypothetical protein
MTLAVCIYVFIPRQLNGPFKNKIIISFQLSLTAISNPVCTLQ